ncbi:hypothetical protein [Rhizobium sp. M1]|uniref:hypothetical protein n=1 Tax=Rhizobium sp. M1 TaxID=2035453 RepID=UPI001143D960|nr:hypothetical protein [Rhizobium sp. M1]
MDKIKAGRKLVEQMLASGELAAKVCGDGKKSLEQGVFLEMCGLGHNFLNGKKHKNDTKGDVLAFLRNVNERLLKSLPQETKDKDDGWRIKYLKLEALHESLQRSYDDSQEAYSRLATRAHHWFLGIREARRENRVLKEKLGVKVVPIPR